MYETAISQTSVNNSAAEIFQSGFAPQLTTINQTNTNSSFATIAQTGGALDGNTLTAVQVICNLNTINVTQYCATKSASIYQVGGSSNTSYSIQKRCKNQTHVVQPGNNNVSDNTLIGEKHYDC
ncbi:hypothetical protein [Microbulbifer sp. JMSA008]|uniref:hypothetical protein n=1 Tax=Microbulbifer sp. JMSA008 TaxID=3243373 RepID=UPI00403A4732